MERKRTPTYLPHEIIESILFRLPVKYLIRFKAVCKQWEITISDPKFAETQLQIFNNSICLRLIAQHAVVKGRAQLVDIENGVSSAVEYPRENLSETRGGSHCDGLFLILCNRPGHLNEYILWNPSRQSHKNLCYPYPFESGLRFGICYDSLVKDYKVVIGDAKHYAVFSCRNNSWSEIKQVSAISCKLPFYTSRLYISSYYGGVSSNGSIYWVFFLNEDSYNSRPFEIVCFNGRDEKLKNLRKLDGQAKYGRLFSSGDDLYLFPYYYDSDNLGGINEILFRKRVGDDEAWMELKVQLPLFCRFVWPLCCTHKNKILVKVCCEGEYLFYLYDESKRSISQIQNSWHFRFPPLFPHVENLFLL